MTALAVSDLAFGYQPGVPILRGLDAAFASGEMVAVTGPSGRGKSTLLYLLGLMLKPQSGAITVLGEPAQALSDAARAHLRAHHYGFVFQNAALDPTRTIMDNVTEASLYRRQPRAEAVEQASELLDRFGVALRADAKPGQVSGGQAQRIALCRALLGRPAIVLADEPTGNLDQASATVVVDALRAEAERGASVVVVTHDQKVVAACDRELTL